MDLWVATAVAFLDRLAGFLKALEKGGGGDGPATVPSEAALMAEEPGRQRVWSATKFM